MALAMAPAIRRVWKLDIPANLIPTILRYCSDTAIRSVTSSGRLHFSPLIERREE